MFLITCPINFIYIIIIIIKCIRFIIIGIYLFIMSIIIHEDFRQIECPLDHSARHVIDATSKDVYVTCMKQDYTEDLFNSVFGPLFILLTFELILVALTHWTVEVSEIRNKPPPYEKLAFSLGKKVEAPMATSTTVRLFF